MYNLILDTSSFLASFRESSPAFKSLERLCERGVMCLHIPYIVKEEFVTHYVSINEPLFKSFFRDMKKLNESYFKDYFKFETTVAKIQDISSELQMVDYFRDWFENWIIKINAKIYNISDGDARKVFEGYFNGRPPFKNVKNRNDIPDAFIFECIKQLSKDITDLNFVCNDITLREAAEKIDNVKGYNSLDKLILEIVNELDESVFIQAHLSEIIKFLKENSKDLTDIIETQGEARLESKDIEICKSYTENNEATIWGTGTPENIKLHFDELKYYGGETFSLPFDFDAECLLDYYIYKADFYCINDDEQKNISVEDWNDHYFRAEEDMNVHASGNLIISFSKLDAQTCDSLNTIQDLVKIEDIYIEDNLKIEVDES